MASDTITHPVSCDSAQLSVQHEFVSFRKYFEHGDARCRSHATKRSPTLWKNKEITPAVRCQQFQWKELTTTWSAGTLNLFGKDGSVFSICSSTGEFLIDTLKIIVTANLCPAPLTDCIACCNAAYDAELADRRPGAYRSTKNISFLYLFTRKNQNSTNTVMRRFVSPHKIHIRTVWIDPQDNLTSNTFLYVLGIYRLYCSRVTCAGHEAPAV